MKTKYTIEQIKAQHIARYNNVLPSDVGLWVYVINNRAYGFSFTKEEAITKAELAVGDL